MLNQVEALDFLGAHELHLHFTFLLVLLGIFILHLLDLAVLSTSDLTSVHDLIVVLLLILLLLVLLAFAIAFLLVAIIRLAIRFAVGLAAWLIGLLGFLLLLLLLIVLLAGCFANLNDCDFFSLDSSGSLLLLHLLRKVSLIFTYASLAHVIGN